MQNPLLERLRYNAHDMGELGKFIRLEYAENILISALEERDRLREAVEEYKAMDREDTYSVDTLEEKLCMYERLVNIHWRSKRDAITAKYGL